MPTHNQRGPVDSLLTAFSSAAPANDETLDALFGGALQLYQKKRGYRFSLDSILLADFATIRSGNKVIDLGTGNGVVPLILAYRYPSISVTGVEIQRADGGSRDEKYSAQRLRRSYRQSRKWILQSTVEHFKPESFDVGRL